MQIVESAIKKLKLVSGQIGDIVKKKMLQKPFKAIFILKQTMKK